MLQKVEATSTFYDLKNCCPPVDVVIRATNDLNLQSNIVAWKRFPYELALTLSLETQNRGGEEWEKLCT